MDMFRKFWSWASAIMLAIAFVMMRWFPNVFFKIRGIYTIVAICLVAWFVLDTFFIDRIRESIENRKEAKARKEAEAKAAEEAKAAREAATIAALAELQSQVAEMKKSISAKK